VPLNYTAIWCIFLFFFFSGIWYGEKTLLPFLFFSPHRLVSFSRDQVGWLLAFFFLPRRRDQAGRLVAGRRLPKKMCIRYS
jgi:hypothetical protein